MPSLKRELAFGPWRDSNRRLMIEYQHYRRGFATSIFSAPMRISILVDSTASSPHVGILQRFFNFSRIRGQQAARRAERKGLALRTLFGNLPASQALNRSTTSRH
jgi:hypothetical protein